MPDTRRVEYTFGVKPDQAAGKAVADLNTQVTTLEKNADRAGRAVGSINRGGGGGSGQGGGPGLGQTLGGPLGGAVSGSAGVVATFYLAMRAIEGITKTMTQISVVATDPTVTEFQKQRSFKEMIPFVKSYLEFLDEVAGWGPRFREIARQSRQVGRQVEGAAVTAASRQANARELNEARIDANAKSGLAANALLNPVANAMLFTTRPELQGVSGAFGQQMQAQADLDKAQKKEALAVNEVRATSIEAQRKLNEVKGIERDIAGRVVKTNDEQLGQDARRVALQRAIGEAQAAVARALAAEESAKSRLQATDQARNALAQANLNMAREQLKLRQEERTKLEGGAAAFGQLAPEDQREAVDAAQRLKRFGFAGVSDEDKALIQRAGLFEQMTNKQAINEGRSSPFFQQALKVAGLRNFDQIDTDMDRFKEEFQKTFIESARSAQSFVDKLGPLLDAITAFKTAMEQLKTTDAMNRDLQRKAAGSGGNPP